MCLSPCTNNCIRDEITATQGGDACNLCAVLSGSSDDAGEMETLCHKQLGEIIITCIIIM